MSEWLQITLAIMGGLITVMTLWNMIEQRVNKTKDKSNVSSSLHMNVSEPQV